MLTDRKALYGSLKGGTVGITFISANSGREITIEASLNINVVPNMHIHRQNVDMSDTLLVWRLDERKWEDIRMESITSWKILTR